MEIRKIVLPRIIIDDKLSFKTHIENIYRTVKYKLHALQRIRKYLSTDKGNTLHNAFIAASFTPLRRGSFLYNNIPRESPSTENARKD